MFFPLFYRNSPDVVFLQEVVPQTLAYIEKQLPEYQCIAAGTEEYFTATLLRRFTTYYDSHRIIDFPSSSMGRNLLLTEVCFFHLSQTADY